ncbi:AsmA-like C-terminal region-containing protein [Desertivirga xinjiangensis]|uniref:AsmA-like C-terminal region-containing protein n=1 Tax=Desertivirga xinjiangensis TaxID=539206 RepID=UPI00210A5B53|nr:AsmA-like C-terminal region-containing protein [Pedobacter xinjiangensis]
MSLKKVLIPVSIIVVLLLGSALCLPYIFKDKILIKVKSTINENVNANVNFKDLDLTLISSFPELGIQLQNLTVIGVDSFATDTLASIPELNMNLNLMSVIKGENYQIHSINLNNPKIYAKVLKSGKANWDISKPNSSSSPADTAQNSFKMALQKYSISNGDIVYDDASLSVFMHLDSLNHTGTGDFTQDLFTLETKSDIEKITVKYLGIPYLNKAKLSANLPLQMNMKQMKFSLAENQIKLNELLLSFVGSLAMPNDTDMVLDFKFNAQQSDLKNFLSLIPSIYSSSFKDLQASGKFAFDGTAKGTYNDTSLPAFNLNFVIGNGKIKYPSLPSSINNINVKALISNPDGVIDHTQVNIPAFHMEFGNVPLDGRLEIQTPVSDPYVDMALKGKLDLKQLTAIFPMKDMSLSGIVDTDVNAKGNKSSIDKGRYQDFKVSGHMIATNFNYSGASVPMPVKISSAKMMFNPSNITLSDLSAKVGKSDLQARGTIDNYLKFAMEKNAKLQGSFSVNSGLMDINELMGPSEPVAKTQKDTSRLTTIEVPANIDFKLGVKADRVFYDNYDIKNANGTLLVKNQTIHFKEMALTMLDGRVTMNGSYATTNPKKPKVAIDFGIEKMSIQKAFETFNTIKMLAPVAKYTQGSFSTTLSFDSELDNTMMPVYSSINATGLTNIIQAIVQGFEPLNKLSSALNTDKLKKLELNNVLAKFKIEQGKLNIAPFNIKKGDFLMNVQGSNGLDQTINYVLGMDVPRSYLGTKATETTNVLIAKFNSKAGTAVDLGETVKVNALVGGTILKPTVKISLAETKDAAKAAVNQLLADKKAELTSKAKQEVSTMAAKSASQIHQKADTLKKQVQEKASEEIKNKLNSIFKKKHTTNTSEPE